jgi:hypothetical protein
MKRATLLFLGLVLGIAGCGPKTRSPIIGKWNVSAAAVPEVRLSNAVLYASHSVPLATRAISDGDKDARFVDWTRVNAEFRPDGTCSLHDGDSKDEGTWTLDGDTLSQTYRGEPGLPSTVAWEGPNRFALVHARGTTFTFVREK